jgi:hypothetical protein
VSSVVHSVRLPVGATAATTAGARVEPDDVIALRRVPGEGVTLPVAATLRRSGADAAQALVVRPGATLAAGDAIARHSGREVTAPSACLFLGYDPAHGTALLAPLGAEQPIVGHVRGRVTGVTERAVEVRVAGAVVHGIGGSGVAVHGTLTVAVGSPAEELRAGSIDAAATGRIVVGGSRASAESLTRARAMGVAGVVIGGLLDKDLRDFEATQLRRRELGGGEFSVLLLEGYGKVGMDPDVFAWLRRHDGKMASLFGAERRLYVYDAGTPPQRRGLPHAGERVVGTRRPYAGAGGTLVRVLPGQQIVASGVAARSGLVRFDDGRTGVVPLANLEATEAASRR